MSFQMTASTLDDRFSIFASEMFRKFTHTFTNFLSPHDKVLSVVIYCDKFLCIVVHVWYCFSVFVLRRLVIAPVCNKQETFTSFHWQYSPVIATVSQGL